MPPSKKFQRDHIINVTYEIVKNEGLQVVNARRIAKELNSSVQPIYLNFSTMEELKNALAELYLKHGNHEIIVDLSQILDRYIVEKQIEKRNKN